MKKALLFLSFLIFTGLASVTTLTTFAAEAPDNRSNLFRYVRFVGDLFSKGKATTTKAIENYAQSGLARIKSAEERAKAQAASNKDKNAVSTSLFRTLFSGKPELIKVALRDEMANLAAESFKSSRANIIIDDEKDGGYHIIVNNYSLTEVSYGLLKNPTITVTINSRKNFDSIVNRQLDPGTAFVRGDIKIQGGGLTQSLKVKAASWVAKYIKR